ncbi:unnamed protein product, partial [Didymodactylos carnosus]
ILTFFYDEQGEDTKETEEQFLLEPRQIKSGDGHFHKKVIEKSDLRLLKNEDGHEGERLYTEGTKINERHTFESIQPQSSSHTIIKRAIPVVPVLLGPPTPYREREETHERYCRA